MSFQTFSDLCTGKYNNKAFEGRVDEVSEKLKGIFSIASVEKEAKEKIKAKLLEEDDKRCAAAINAANEKNKNLKREQLLAYLPDKVEGIPLWQYLWNKPQAALAALAKIKYIPPLIKMPSITPADKDYKTPIPTAAAQIPVLDEKSPATSKEASDHIANLLTEKNQDGETLLEHAILNAEFSEEQLIKLIKEFYTEETLGPVVDKIVTEVNDKLFERLRVNGYVVLQEMMAKSKQIATQLLIFSGLKPAESWLNQLKGDRSLWGVLINLLKMVDDNTKKDVLLIPIVDGRSILFEICAYQPSTEKGELANKRLEERAISAIQLFDRQTLPVQFFEGPNPIFPHIWNKPKLVLALLKIIFSINTNKGDEKIDSNQSEIPFNKIFGYQNQQKFTLLQVAFQSFLDEDLMPLLKFCSTEWWHRQIDIMHSSTALRGFPEKLLNLLINNNNFYSEIYNIINEKDRAKLTEVCKKKWEERFLQLSKSADQKELAGRSQELSRLMTNFSEIDNSKARELIDQSDGKNECSTYLKILCKGTDEKAWIAAQKKAGRPETEQGLRDDFKRTVVKQDDKICSAAINKFSNNNVISYLSNYLNKKDDTGTPLWVYLWNKPESILAALRLTNIHERSVDGLLYIVDKKGQKLLDYALAEFADADLSALIEFYSSYSLENIFIPYTQINGHSQYIIAPLALRLWNKPQSLSKVIEKIRSRHSDAYLTEVMLFQIPAQKKESCASHVLVNFKDDELLKFLEAICCNDPSEHNIIRPLREIIQKLWLELWSKPLSVLYIIKFFSHHRVIADLFNVKDKNGNTLLHHAAEHYTAEQLQELVSYLHTDIINQILLTCNTNGLTPLHIADRAGKTQNFMVLTQSADCMIVNKSMSLLDSKDQKTPCRYSAHADALKIVLQITKKAVSTLIPISLKKTTADQFMASLPTVDIQQLDINKDNIMDCLQFFANRHLGSFTPFPNAFLAALSYSLNQNLLNDTAIKDILKMAMNNKDTQEFIGTLNVLGVDRVGKVFADVAMWAQLIKTQSLTSCTYLLSMLPPNKMSPWVEIGKHLNLTDDKAISSSATVSVSGISSSAASFLPVQSKPQQNSQTLGQKIKVFATLYEQYQKLNIDEKSLTDEKTSTSKDPAKTPNNMSDLLRLMNDQKSIWAAEVEVWRCACSLNSSKQDAAQARSEVYEEFVTAINDLTSFSDGSALPHCSAPQGVENRLIVLTPADQQKVKDVQQLRLQILQKRFEAIDKSSPDWNHRLSVRDYTNVLPLLLYKFEIGQADAKDTESLKYFNQDITQLSMLDMLLLGTLNCNVIRIFIKKASNQPLGDTETRYKALQALGWDNICLQMGGLVRWVKSKKPNIDRYNQEAQLLCDLANLKNECERTINPTVRQENIDYWNQVLNDAIIRRFNNGSSPSKDDSEFNRQLLNLSMELDRVSDQPYYLAKRFELIALTQQFIDKYADTDRYFSIFGKKREHIPNLKQLKDTTVKTLLSESAQNQNPDQKVDAKEADQKSNAKAENKKLKPLQLIDYETTLNSLYDAVNKEFKIALQKQGIKYKDKESLKGLDYLTNLAEFLEKIRKEVDLVAASKLAKQPSATGGIGFHAPAAPAPSPSPSPSPSSAPVQASQQQPPALVAQLQQQPTAPQAQPG